MQHIKRVGVIVAGAALLVSGALVGGPDMTDTYQDGRRELVAPSGDPGSAGLYRNAAEEGPRVGAIGISGDGIDQDDLTSRYASDIPSKVDARFSPPGPANEGGPLFGVQFS